jgi:hypothetical protein
MSAFDELDDMVSHYFHVRCLVDEIRERVIHSSPKPLVAAVAGMLGYRGEHVESPTVLLAWSDCCMHDTPREGPSLLQRFANDNQFDDPDEQRLLEAMRTPRLGVFRVSRCSPTAGVQLADTATGEMLSLLDPPLGRLTQRHQKLLTRLVEVDNFWVRLGPPLLLSADVAARLQRLLGNQQRRDRFTHIEATRIALESGAAEAWDRCALRPAVDPADLGFKNDIPPKQMQAGG